MPRYVRSDDRSEFIAGVPRSGNYEKFGRRLQGDLYTEQQVQGRRRGYYEDREAAADAEEESGYGRYRDRTDALADEAAGVEDYDAPVYEGDPDAPVDEGYEAYVGREGGLYGEQDGGDLSQYGDRSYYQQDIDPNSRLGRMLDRSEGELAPTDYASYFNSLAGAANNQLTSRIRTATADLESTAAGRGRLDSSLFSRDAGSLYQDMAADSRADLTRGALDAASLTQRDRESIRDSRGRLVGSVLEGMNLNSRAASSAADAGYNRARLAQGNRAAARAGYENTRDTGEDTFRDRRDTRRDRFESDRDFGYDVYDDKRAAGERSRSFRAGLYGDQYGAASDRSRDAYDRGEDQRGAYRDLTAGNYDRVQGEVNERKRRKSELIGGIIGGVTRVASAAVGGG